jgi:hypothetical protein
MERISKTESRSLSAVPGAFGFFFLVVLLKSPLMCQKLFFRMRHRAVYDWTDSFNFFAQSSKYRTTRLVAFCVDLVVVRACNIFDFVGERDDIEQRKSGVLYFEQNASHVRIVGARCPKRAQFGKCRRGEILATTYDQPLYTNTVHTSAGSMSRLVLMQDRGQAVA